MRLDLLNAFRRYYSDRLFEREFNDGLNNLLKYAKIETQPSEVVLCLILAQAMEDMLDGYGGRSSISRRIGDEATGYYLGGNSSNVPERYRQLVDCIRELRKVDETFDRMVDSVVRKSIHLI